MLVAYREQCLFIGTPFGFSQKIRKFLLGSQGNLPMDRLRVNETGGGKIAHSAAMLANFFRFSGIGCWKKQ
jgi:hypothetical protein